MSERSAAGRIVDDADALIRIHFLGFSALQPLLGAASVDPYVSSRTILGLLGVTFCFHVYTYVLNDVIDLPIDRQQPLRATDPLVRGAISRGAALLIALVGVPGALLVAAWLGVAPPGYVALGSAIVLMTGYNLWGKRSPFPPLTDLVQGLAIASVVMFGAFAAGASPTLLSYTVAAQFAVYIMLINGIHGSQRDVENDLHFGCRTTAILLGVRPTADGTVLTPAHYRWYARALHLVLVALAASSLLRNDYGYGRAKLALTMAAFALLACCSFWLMETLMRPERPGWRLAVRLHPFVMLLLIAAGFIPSLPLRMLVPLGLILLITPLGTQSGRSIAVWLLRGGRGRIKVEGAVDDHIL